MLWKLITLLSAVTAGLICWGAGAFGSMSWLWMLPLGFAGGFLGWVLAAVIVLWLLCLPVDQSKPQTEDSPFYRGLAAVYIEALIALLRVRVHAEGLEKTPKEGRFLLVCNHQHVADPGILLHYFKDSQLAFISKQENQKLFAVGPIMHRILCQPIDRDNDRQALKGILNCIGIIREDKASIGVFPEGYTSRDGKLHHFRSGVFKIAQKTKVPIVVCTLNGSRMILKNAARLKPSDVALHLVGVLQPEDYAGMNTVQLGQRVFDMMLADLGPEFAPEDGE